MDGSISIMCHLDQSGPSIVHSMVVEGGIGVEYTPTFFYVQCLLGVIME